MPGAIEKNKGYDNEVNDMKKFFMDSKAYNDAATHEEKNLRFEAMRGIFTGKQTLYIHADKIKEITDQCDALLLESVPLTPKMRNFALRLRIPQSFQRVILESGFQSLLRECHREVGAGSFQLRP